MGGHIEVSSVPGQGSVFEVHLPYRPSAPADASPMLPPLSLAEDTKPLQGLKILVAEDTEINQEILRENLTEDGAEVIIVEDGQQVVDCVRNSPPGSFDVVLMDIQMPIKSGYEAAREIAAIAPALPIIAQTAHALPQDRDACAAAGMIDHISKPIDPELLVQMILKYTAIRS
jgi:CheY-like chemotaxis protein